jgi:hypothetical protein
MRMHGFLLFFIENKVMNLSTLAYIYLKRGQSMKKLLFYLFMLIVFYAIYYDLNKGTLPESITNARVQPISNQTPTLPYQEVVVQPGDTVISLYEKYSSSNKSISINELTKDFISLNDGASPYSLQPGKKIRIPIY